MTVGAILIIIGLAAAVFADLFVWFGPNGTTNSYRRVFLLLVLGVILIGIGALLPSVSH